MKITLEMLQEVRACQFSLTQFELAFGKEVEVTAENVNLATDKGMGPYSTFLAESFLSSKGYEIWAENEHLLVHESGANACPGCRASLMKFAELYSNAEYRRTS